MKNQLFITSFLFISIISQSINVFAKSENLQAHYKNTFSVVNSTYSSGCQKDVLYCILTAPTVTASLPFLILGVFVDYMDSNKIAITSAENEAISYMQEFNESSNRIPALSPVLLNAIETIQLQLKISDSTKAELFESLPIQEQVEIVLFLSNNLD